MRCRRRKGKLPCSEVRAMLAQQAGGSGEYDAMTALRLLPCDAACKAAQVHVLLVIGIVSLTASAKH